MSTHNVQVVRLSEPQPHPSANRLDIFQIGGWQTVVRKGLFKPGDLAVFVPFDYVVPPHTLGGDQEVSVRIKPAKLRGVLSQGCLIQMTPELQSAAVEGQDVTEALGITRYEPALQGSQGTGQAGPTPDLLFSVPVFDVENFENYADLFVPGEQVIATEKLHGANARYVWARDKGTEQYRLFIGTRKRWLYPDDQANDWCRVLTHYPIELWCQSHPETTLYGEIFGTTQSLKYGSPTKPLFAAFAVYDKDGWWDPNGIQEAVESHLPTPAIVYQGPYDKQVLVEKASGDSCVPGAGHEREGIVVQTWPHLRQCHNLGPLRLKIVNPDYLIRS